MSECAQSDTEIIKTLMIFKKNIPNSYIYVDLYFIFLELFYTSYTDIGFLVSNTTFERYGKKSTNFFLDISI